MTPEQRFIAELNLFRTEAQSGAQFLYSYLTFNAVVGKKRAVRSAVNKSPLFWNTTMGALQTSFFIVLGRIFDQESPHNLDRLLKLAQDNRNIFSKAALAKRKRQISTNADDWLEEYLMTAYEPTNDDFRNLRKKVKEHRRVYVANYRDIRHKIFAHKEVSDAEEVQRLFSKTNIRELQKIFVFANALYEALWELTYNGRKPVLRPMRYSVARMLRDRKPDWQIRSVQERMVTEIHEFLEKLASPTRHSKGRANSGTLLD